MPVRVDPPAVAAYWAAGGGKGCKLDGGGGLVDGRVVAVWRDGPFRVRVDAADTMSYAQMTKILASVAMSS